MCCSLIYMTVKDIVKYLQNSVTKVPLLNMDYDLLDKINLYANFVNK